MANNSGVPHVLALTEGGTGGTTQSAALTGLGLKLLRTSSQGAVATLDLDNMLSPLTLHVDDQSGVIPLLGYAALGVIAIKSTTGDPANADGFPYIVINNVDNNVKIFADGAWRQLATW